MVPGVSFWYVSVWPWLERSIRRESWWYEPSTRGCFHGNKLQNEFNYLSRIFVPICQIGMLICAQVHCRVQRWAGRHLAMVGRGVSLNYLHIEAHSSVSPTICQWAGGLGLLRGMGLLSKSNKKEQGFYKVCWLISCRVWWSLFICIYIYIYIQYTYRYKLFHQISTI